MNLEQCRNEIDRIDDEMSLLFKKRMDIAEEVAKYKLENDIPILNKERERSIVTRVTENVGDEYAMYAKFLYNTVFELSRAHQVKLKSSETALYKKIKQALEQSQQLFPQKATVACQGVEGAYSQVACDNIFPLASIMYMSSFESVFNAVEKGLCTYGILPLENSSNGSINEVYDLMKKHKFHIVRSVKQKLSHSLLAHKGVKFSDIKEIYSHSQAIAQCSEFLEKHKHIKVVPCENTAFAAKMIFESNRKDVAAISSFKCAELYGLENLGEKVQNFEDSYTTFICISKNLEIYGGANKINFMTTVSHTPGALGSLLGKFSAIGLNLSKIESRPMPGTDFAFMFYFTIDGSVWSEDVLRLFSDMSETHDQFEFLGAYTEL